MYNLIQTGESGDVIVLAGDIFDLYVGDKKVFSDRFKEFLSESKNATNRGVAIHYIEGNHDFHLNKAFLHTGIRVHDAEVNLKWNEKNVHIAHGDLVNRRDIGYLLLRWILRSSLMKGLIKLWPDRFLDRFGSSWSAYSRKNNGVSTDLERIEKLKNIYREYARGKFIDGYQLVVLGHCHIIDEWFVTDSEGSGLYYNMGFPPVHMSYIRWTSDSPVAERVKLLPTG